MNLTIERDILAVALSRVTPLIVRSMFPILGCLKLAVDGGIFNVTAQNGTASASQTALVVGDAEPAVCCVQADKFGALVNSLPKGSQIELETVGQKLIVHYGRGKASFPLENPDSFPVIRAIEGAEPFQIEAAELHRLLAMALPFAFDEQSRPYLCGVFLRGEEARLTAVATDGNGMIVGRSDTPCAFADIIVPREGCAPLLRALVGASGEASVAVSESGLSVTLGGYMFITKLVDGTFPEFERVIPAAVENPILIESGALQEVTQRAQAVTEAADATRSAPRSITLETTDYPKLHISAGSDADQKIDEDIELDCAPGLVSINLGTAYVLDAISSLGEGLLQLHITGPMNPALIRRDGNDQEFAVLMPRRA